LSIVKVTQNVEKARGFFITAVAGATVLVKLAGTMTNATHYADEDGTSPTTSTLTADESGKVVFFIDEGDYDWYAYPPGHPEDMVGPFPFAVLTYATGAAFDPDALADGSVDGAKLVDGSVTDDKLATPPGGGGANDNHAAQGAGGSLATTLIAKAGPIFITADGNYLVEYNGVLFYNKPDTVQLVFYINDVGSFGRYDTWEDDPASTAYRATYHGHLYAGGFALADGDKVEIKLNSTLLDFSTGIDEGTLKVIKVT